MSAPPPEQPLDWRPRFFTIWTGQAFSLLGSMLVQFALVWWLTKTTGSATVLAQATIVALLPAIFLSPFAGTLVDRWNRRVVMIAADGSIALASLWLAYVSYTGALQSGHVYVVMFLRSAAAAFHWPAMQASTSLLVPKDVLARIAGLNQTLNGTMSIISPALGALLVVFLPLYAVLMVDVVTALLAICPLFFIAVPQPRRAEGSAEGPSSVGRELLDGLRYVARWPGLLRVLILAGLINVLTVPGYVLLPILATRHFHGDAWHLGMLNSAQGLGLVLGGLILGAWGGFRRRIMTSLAGLVGAGVGMVAVGLMPPSAFWPAVVAIAFCGLMHPIVNGPFFALIQTLVAPEMQGRVLGLVNSIVTGIMPLSMIVAGPVADALGVSFWFIIGGVGCVLISVAALSMPSITGLEENRQQPAENRNTESS